ncbi:MAG: prefoldin subunit alpha [Candidatus Heimdallarchaeota archaeon]|nr:prefoldin subunit alpha [Candidatus Heimdallarchaeota archaeon]MCK5142611.1 prefoldin subunit alpha [Candidatus Heimdallarchaeota archaeon]
MKRLSKDSSPKQVSQEELNNLLMAAQQLEQQATRYNQQIEVLNGYYNEIHSAEQTLRDLDKAEENNKILVPIGAGNFIYATVENGENVIVTIGAGVHNEKSLQDAIEGIKKKKTDVENQLTQIKASYNEVIERLREVDRVVKSVM